jgi:hypothetical protein
VSPGRDYSSRCDQLEAPLSGPTGGRPTKAAIRSASCRRGRWSPGLLVLWTLVGAVGALSAACHEPTCKSPNVLRYEKPGCGDQAVAVCGPSFGDGCAALACGCDGETLVGCDFYTKPWRDRARCPNDCFSPTHDVETQFASNSLKGCSCDPTVDRPQCVPTVGGSHGSFVCMDGAWTATFTAGACQ